MLISREDLLSLLRANEITRTRLEHEFAARNKVVPCESGVALARVLGRYHLYLDMTDASVASHLAMQGYWEIWITRALARGIDRTEGATAVDIGANAGYYTFLLADLVGPKGRVVAFEPQPRLAKLLRRSIHTTSGMLGVVEVEQKGVGDLEDEAAFLWVPPHNHGSAAILTERPNPSATPVHVHMVTLDAMFPADVEPPSIIKIDAEGSEQRIWRGMQQVLKRAKQLKMLIEFSPSGYEDAGSFLRELRECFEVRLIDEESALQEVSTDFILSQPMTMLFLT